MEMINQDTIKEIVDYYGGVILYNITIQNILSIKIDVNNLIFWIRLSDQGIEVDINQAKGLSVTDLVIITSIVSDVHNRNME